MWRMFSSSVEGVFTLLVSTIVLVTSFGCQPPSAPSSQGDGPSTETTSATKEFLARPAEVGVGKQGQSLENETGVGRIIAQPAITLFQTKQKVVFEIQIPQALALFDGLNGRFPKSHEEFMEKIIRENRIALPKLPDGQVYRYRPDEKQLWVEPADSSEAP